ncbi:hypothetical protein SDC9_198270 [bioreactor metagenome]|uniref:Tetratricopeptide repeat protein n=1 Tax=bioreactor metagenome TaxID=1076179 RepID=A0A645IH65_9ZZZZ
MEKEYEEAIEILSNGIKYNPEECSLYYNRACILCNVGRLEEAAEDMRKGIKLYPKFIEYVKRDKELKPIKEFFFDNE